MTLKCLPLLALWAVTLTGSGLSAAQPAVEEVCRVPAELSKSRVRLEQVATALKSKHPIKIVVLGTGSSAGTGVSRPQAAYPARLEGLLNRDWGPKRVVVVNLSQSGQTASQMADRIPAIIREQQPHLIIWQTGTVDALKGIDVNDFGDAIERGIHSAEDGKVDMVIVDSQYGSQAMVLRDETPYLEYLDQIVRGRDVILFHRYAIMKYWVDSGNLNFGEMPRPQQLQVADRVHDCIAQLLASMIGRATVR
jgi:acyl-CoA thioesterase-1